MSAFAFVTAPVVEPRYDHARLERARLLNAARADLLESGTAVTVTQLADATGVAAGTVRQRIARARKRGTLITVEHNGETLVPTVQLDDAFGFRDDVGAIVARLTADNGMDGWAVWDWFETPNGWLDTTPAEAVAAGNLDQVHAAVNGLLQ